MRRKNRKMDKEYLAYIHTLPCAVSGTGIRYACRGRITAHHAGTRGLMQKADDRTAIPLCEWHHQEGPDAIHKLGKKFWKHHGLDKDLLISLLQSNHFLTPFEF
jgi:hypothetical protein